MVENWTWLYTPVILALRRLKQKDGEFKASLLHKKALSQNKTKQNKTNSPILDEIRRIKF
jgi:hypothetical protein